MLTQKATNRLASPTRQATGSEVIWTGAIVAVSLAAMAKPDILPQAKNTSLAFAYCAPLAAYLCLSAFFWLKYREHGNTRWQRISAILFLAFMLTGHQALLEIVAPQHAREMAWQPWHASRFLLAAGILLSLSGWRCLSELPSGGRRTVGILAAMALISCPVWTDSLPADLAAPAAGGLTVIDCMLIVFSGFASVGAYIRIRNANDSTRDSRSLLSFWLLALGWSAACRAYPFDNHQTAIMTEMLVISMASVLVVVRIVWLGAEALSASRREYKQLQTSHRILRDLTGRDKNELAEHFITLVSRFLGCSRAMLIIRQDDGEAVQVAALTPMAGSPSQRGDIIEMSTGRRSGAGGGPAARCMLEKKPVVVDEVFSDVFFVPWTEAASQPSFQVSIPLIKDDYCFGAVLLWFSGTWWNPAEQIKLAENAVEAAHSILARLKPEPDAAHSEVSSAA